MHGCVEPWRPAAAVLTRCRSLAFQVPPPRPSEHRHGGAGGLASSYPGPARAAAEAASALHGCIHSTLPTLSVSGPDDSNTGSMGMDHHSNPSTNPSIEAHMDAADDGESDLGSSRNPALSRSALYYPLAEVRTTAGKTTGLAGAPAWPLGGENIRQRHGKRVL